MIYLFYFIITYLALGVVVTWSVLNESFGDNPVEVYDSVKHFCIIFHGMSEDEWPEVTNKEKKKFVFIMFILFTVMWLPVLISSWRKTN